VERSFQPVGNWQLHLVRGRISFRCVLCRQEQDQALWAATKVGSTQELACQPCYRGTLREHYAKKSEPSKKHSERDRSRRRLPGVDRVVSFFRSAGVAAELTRDGCLRVNGAQTRPLPQVLPPPGTFDWDEVIDEMTLRYASGKFINAVADNGRFGGGRAFLRRSDLGFVIMRGNVRLGLIRATHAYVPGHDAIVANFLLSGPHWPAVADLIREAEPALVAKWEREHAPVTTPGVAESDLCLESQSAVRYIRRLPRHLAPELRRACIAASRRLRLERQVAYERPVVLVCDYGELTLRPVIETGSTFCLPFRLVTGPTTIRAALVLGDSDPLSLQIGEHVAFQDAVMAWTSALLGFADVTCIQFDSSSARMQSGHRRPPSSASSVPAPRRSRQSAPRRHPWPGHLEPIGRWTRYSGSFVAGHRRLLNDGQTASDEARQRARQVGITLRSHETWVRPHARGIPDAVEMRFQWHAPEELNLLQVLAKG
jgi:hypothetical protein